MVELCFNISTLLSPSRQWLCNTGSMGVYALYFHASTPDVTVHYNVSFLARQTTVPVGQGRRTGIRHISLTT